MMGWVHGSLQRYYIFGKEEGPPDSSVLRVGIPTTTIMASAHTYTYREEMYEL